MNVGKNSDGGGIDISSILAAFFWQRLIKNMANLGQNSQFGRVL